MNIKGLAIIVAGAALVVAVGTVSSCASLKLVSQRPTGAVVDAVSAATDSEDTTQAGDQSQKKKPADPAVTDIDADSAATSE
jgi:hypothetical protein